MGLAQTVRLQGVNPLGQNSAARAPTTSAIPSPLWPRSPPASGSPPVRRTSVLSDMLGDEMGALAISRLGAGCLWQVLSLPCHRTPRGSAGHTPQPTRRALPWGKQTLLGQSRCGHRPSLSPSIEGPAPAGGQDSLLFWAGSHLPGTASPKRSPTPPGR